MSLLFGARPAGGFVKITNTLLLPQALVEAVANDPYTKGRADLSVTQIIKPMRAVVLEEAHRDEIVEDVSDRLWSLYGQVMHGILERSNKDNVVVTERRLYMEVDGMVISGGMDHYNLVSGHLIDWKFTTSWKFTGNKDLEDWTQQVNCYAELLRVNGHKIESLEIIGILRDWSKNEARRNPEYPQKQVVRKSMPLWPREEVLSFIRTRIQDYKNAKEQLPTCSDKERWSTGGSKWAVTEASALKAIKQHGSEEEALKHRDNLQNKYQAKNYSVEFRPAENKRCDSFCSAAPFCSQYKQLKSEK